MKKPPGNKHRTSFQREADLERISALYLQRKTQSEIAAIIGVTQQAICYDIKLILKRWRESEITNINEAKNAELAKILDLERTYQQKFEETGSLKPLLGVQWCVEQRCKLLGLYAPAKQEVTGEAGGPVVVSFTRWPGADDGSSGG
jgi:hypothetical protein